MRPINGIAVSRHKLEVMQVRVLPREQTFKNNNMNNLTILIYYIYATIIIALSGYVVFVLNHSGWWFILTFLFIQVTPVNSKK